MPIWVIFNTRTLGLSNTEAFILGVLSYGFSALFEIPTGSWADTYGRAKIYRIGVILYIVAVGSFIFLTNFYLLATMQIIGALGLAMQSGCLEALIHDSILGNDKDVVYAHVHGRKMAIAFASRVITVLCGSLLFTINPRAPFIATIVVYFVSLLISLSFKELRLETPNELSHSDHIKETIALLMTKRVLLSFLLLALLFTLCSEALFALYQPYFQSIGIHVGQFGIFYAVISAVSAIGSLASGRLIKRFHIMTILLGMMLGMLCTLSLMLVQNKILLYAAIIPSSIAFGFSITLTNTAVQKVMSSKYQATALSLASFLQNLAFFVAVVAVGLTLDHTRVMTVVMGLTIITVICTVVIARFAYQKSSLTKIKIAS